MNNYYNQQNEKIMTMEEIVKAASVGDSIRSKKDSESTEKIKLKITPEEFKTDYKKKMISTSEICELLTQRLGTVFQDYEGCKDIDFAYAPFNGFSLVFDFKDSNNEHDTRLKALERCGNIKDDNTMVDEMRIIAQYNAANSARNDSKKGIISENSMGFRLSNDAINILKDTLFCFGDDNKNHDRFRRQCVTYALDTVSGNHNILIVSGISIENVLSFIYGKQYDYNVRVGAPINTGSYSGYLLEVSQLHPDATREAIRKYVNRQIVSDGLYRPNR